MGLTTRDLEKSFLKITVATEDILSNIVTFNHGEEAESEEDEVTKEGVLSEVNERGWVIGTSNKTGLQWMERFW
jgi:hypothetical protein